MAKATALAALLSAMLLLAAALGISQAHQSHTGQRYDPECCSGYDCAPAKTVVLNADGSRTITNELGLTATFERGFIVRPSTDGKLHSCVSRGSGRPLCLYGDSGV